MKKMFLILTVIVCTSIPAMSLDLEPLGRDVEAMFRGIGNETTPYFFQNALIGDGIGRAHMGEESVFFVSFTPGVTFTPGILTFIDQTNSKFEMLNVYGLLEMGLNAAPDIKNLFQFFQTFFILPQSRIAIGFQLPFQIEVIGLFSIIPQILTDGIAQLAQIQGIEFSDLNVGIRIRKALLLDKGGFPAISIGAGYSFSYFHAGYSNFTFSQDISGFSLSMNGSLGLDTSIHTGGLDLYISKQLAIFFPYLRFSAYYQWSDYKAYLSPFKADMKDPAGTVLISSNITPLSALQIQDLAFLISGGIEIQLGAFILTPGGSFNIPTQSFSASLGMRLQF